MPSVQRPRWAPLGNKGRVALVEAQGPLPPALHLPREVCHPVQALGRHHTQVPKAIAIDAQGGEVHPHDSTW